MPKLSIDGREVEVPDATNLVQAAARVGIEIPTYCYHPGLSVVGQCRICFVEVEGAPRVVTACSTPARDGMVVLTASQKVRDARAAVMEFLLENHPLDCPVCDQAGECYLQDYSVAHGLSTTHMVDVRRRFPGFERRMIGPHVVQNQNRCIHCTRCIRFTQEISETHDLTMKSRGNSSYIDTFDGEPYDNPWSACAADVCPVGALTVKEFRFRARVWHLTDTESVCPGCSVGCAVKIGHLDEIVYRFLPRENALVNGWWMCDYGRFLSEELNRREVDRPHERAGETAEPLHWHQAVARLRDLFQAPAPARVVASANLSNEALYLVKTVLADKAGLEVVVPVDVGEGHKVKNGRREWVESRDAHPNSTGARLLGLRPVDGAALVDFVKGGSGPLVVLDNLAHPWLATEEAAAAIGGRETAVVARVHTPLSRRASLLLPVASWAEMEGTSISSTGRVQLAERCFPPHGQSRPQWEILGLLAVLMGQATTAPTSPRRIFEQMAAAVPAFAGMTYQRLRGGSGLPVAEGVPDVG